MYNPDIFYSFLEFLPNYEPLIVFFSILIFGENGLIILSSLSSKFLFSPLNIIFFSSIAMLFLDSFWFFVTKIKKIDFLIEKAKSNKSYKIVESRISKISNKNDALILFIAKLLIGTRILIIIYLSNKRISYFKFLKYDFFPTFIWVFILFCFGWLSGKGVLFVWDVFRSIQLVIFLIFVLIILYYFIIGGINQWLMKRRKKLI
jgi:membrane protein DedA with SNARE-associated domain